MPLNNVAYRITVEKIKYVISTDQFEMLKKSRVRLAESLPWTTKRRILNFTKAGLFLEREGYALRTTKGDKVLEAIKARIKKEKKNARVR